MGEVYLYLFALHELANFGCRTLLIRWRFRLAVPAFLVASTKLFYVKPDYWDGDPFADTADISTRSFN